MLKKAIHVLIILVFTTIYFLFIPSASIIFADNATLYYAYYQSDNYYGIKSEIHVPFDVPHIEQCYQADGDCFQFHAVSIPPPHWIQTGWAYHPDFIIPMSYYEYCLVDCELGIHQGDPAFFGKIYPEEHFWGESKQYEVLIDPLMPGDWCAKIEGLPVKCGSMGLMSSVMFAMSESHNIPQNEFNTLFSDIQLRDANDNWSDPILDNHFYNTFPYKPIKETINSFRTIGRQWDIHLPIMEK